MADIIAMWVAFGILLLLEAWGVCYVMFFKPMKGKQDFIDSCFWLLLILLLMVGTGVTGWQTINEVLNSMG